MAQAIEKLPDDPNELKAMLIAERVRNERLVQIIKEFQRHRFGRRAETLPEEQMLLALLHHPTLDPKLRQRPHELPILRQHPLHFADQITNHAD
jgi:hypothetical protein